MEEDDEEVSLTSPQRRKSSIPEPSLYRSTQGGLNQGSEQTLYQSVRNTLYEDAVSMNSMHSAISLDNLPAYTDESSTINDTNESVIDGSCTGTRNSVHESRLVRTTSFYNLIEYKIHREDRCVNYIENGCCALAFVLKYFK